MLTVTTDFKNALREPISNVTGYIELQDGTQLKPDEVLQKYTIDSTGGFLRTAMSKITINLLGDQYLAGSVVDAYYGVYYDGSFTYAVKGKFNITEAAYNKTTNTTVLTGYDNMSLFAVDYATVGTYPTTLYAYLQAVCSLAGVALENDTIYNGDLVVDEDYYQNIGSYTVRDVLEDICEASASYAIVNATGNIELRQITDTGEVLTYDDMKEHDVGDPWGGINSLVLSRQPQNDDIFMRDETDINAPTTRNVMDLSKFNVGYKVGDS